jgi:hypothetical protein
VCPAEVQRVSSKAFPYLGKESTRSLLSRQGDAWRTILSFKGSRAHPCNLHSLPWNLLILLVGALCCTSVRLGYSDIRASCSDGFFATNPLLKSKSQLIFLADVARGIGQIDACRIFKESMVTFEMFSRPHASSEVLEPIPQSFQLPHIVVLLLTVDTVPKFFRG